MSRASRSKSSKTAPAGWAARRAAADLLHRVASDGDALDAALSNSDFFDALDGSDRGFARAIAGASLRAQGRIDRALDQLLDRPFAKIDPPVQAMLRAGAAQLWVLGTPPYAAVSATVEAARRWKPAARGGGLINAVLRRADRDRDAYADLATSTIWPDWLAARLKSALGPERADALAELQLHEPTVDLTVKSGPAGWAARLGGDALPSGSVRLPPGAPLQTLDGYADGAWWVQDAGAALAVKLLGDVEGLAVADLCAAPGGKTLQLAAAGARVTALDVSAPRLERLRENLDRTGLEAEIVVADAVQWRPDTPFDAVVLDAPCSALGTLRRHPEGAWRRDPKQLARYPKRQSDLLSAARAYIKPGGVLIYCVCTPLPEEGVDVVEAAIADGGWRRIPISAADAPGFEAALTQAGDLLTAPPSDETSPEASVLSDVFQISRLEKV